MSPQLIDQIKAEHVPAVFGSEVFPSTVLEQIAKEAGAQSTSTSSATTIRRASRARRSTPTSA